MSEGDFFTSSGAPRGGAAGGPSPRARLRPKPYFIFEAFLACFFANFSLTVSFGLLFFDTLT